jgi:predicted nucleic acid-binding protein
MTLVDASSWIEFLRGRNTGPSERVKTLLKEGKTVWCDITLVELWNGAQGHLEKAALKELEQEVRLYPVNASAWLNARELARRCREKGVTASTADIIVAACAAEHNLPLEHCDHHFDRILPIAAKL